MGVIPNGKTEKITFFETRVDGWAAGAGSIGLAPEQAARIAALTAAARAAYTAAQAAAAAARAATLAQDEAIAAMAGYGGDLVKTIKAFAETEGGPGVYSAAQIPAPRPRTPLGPAPTPAGLTAGLTNAGAIELRWTARAAGRIGFRVERRLAAPGRPAGAWRLIGTSTAARFTDAAVPTGLAGAQYRVSAERPGGRSEPTEPIEVLFGTAPAAPAAEAPAASGGRMQPAA